MASSLSIYQKQNVTGAIQQLESAHRLIDLALTADAVDELDDAELLSNSNKEIDQLIHKLKDLVE